MSKTIVFFGTDIFSAAALRSLIDAGYTIGAVVTKPDSKSGRGHKLAGPLVKEIALEHGIKVLQPTKLLDIVPDIEALGDVTERIGVLSSYGRIVPQAVIDLFHPGIINIHPSLLPLYRGPSPIETAIVNGDERTGVSIMKLSAEMDAGPVYAQEVYPLDGTETAPQLYDTLSELGGRMLVETLPEIIKGNLLPSPQQNAAIYCYLLKKEDGVLNALELTAIEAERRVRAYVAFPKTKIVLNPETDDIAILVVTKAHVLHAGEEKDDKQLVIPFKNNSFLVVDELIGPSGKRMSGAAFKNGYAA
jgi:methionyl-tRNA formyltransferase